MTDWTKKTPPERPLWFVVTRRFTPQGKEEVQIFYASISSDRTRTEIFLEELRRRNPHAIFELAEC